MNAVPDPGFESGVLVADYRTVGAGATDTSAVVTSPVISGSYSLRVSSSTGVGSAGAMVVVGWRAVAAPDQVWDARATAAFVTSGLQARLLVLCLDAGGATVTTTSTTVTSRDPTRAEVTGVVVPPTAVTVVAACGLYAGTPGLAGQAVFDDVVLTRDGLDAPEIADAVALEEMLQWVPEHFYAGAA